MRYPDATWRPTDKHGYGDFDTHSQEGVVIHSMEGSLQAGFGVLDGPRQASWHFSISKTGEVYQHVDTDQIAWTNGGYDANKLWWGIECEGVAGEALTEPQYQALLQVLRWLWATHEVGAPVRQETLWEHREMTRFGSPSTSCPSGRIPWAALINEWEDDMALDPVADKATFEKMLRSVLSNTEVIAIDDDNNKVGGYSSLGLYLYRIRQNGSHAKDAAQHGADGDSYTDEQAVKAVKAKL